MPREPPSNCSGDESLRCRYFNPKTGNRKLFSQALQLFLEAVNELPKHCSEKFGLALRYSIDQDSSLVGGEVGLLRNSEE